MQEYNIKIFRQSRILLSLFLLPVLFLLSIFLGAKLNSFIIPIALMVVWIFIFYYFSFGNLKIIIKNENELFFEWEKKFIFNYKSIDPVKIRDIKTIVLDNGSSLKKIKTIDHTIYINNSNINSNDMVKFIEKIKEDNIRIIDSWDEFKEKGYLKMAYLINTIVLIITFIVFIIFTILRGFNPFYLSIFLLFIPQIILYQKHIKSKIRK
jgi:hypothetical protein